MKKFTIEYWRGHPRNLWEIGSWVEAKDLKDAVFKQHEFQRQFGITEDENGHAVTIHPQAFRIHEMTPVEEAWFRERHEAVCAEADRHIMAELLSGIIKPTDRINA